MCVGSSVIIYRMDVLVNPAYGGNRGWYLGGYFFIGTGLELIIWGGGIMESKTPRVGSTGGDVREIDFDWLLTSLT
jgi:hypothetical protein